MKRAILFLITVGLFTTPGQSNARAIVIPDGVHPSHYCGIINNRKFNRRYCRGHYRHYTKYHHTRRPSCPYSSYGKNYKKPYGVKYRSPGVSFVVRR